jgi:hypothetical protein
MPRAENYEQWLAMKKATLEKPKEALPAPNIEVVDAEFVEVKPFTGIEL